MVEKHREILEALADRSPDELNALMDAVSALFGMEFGRNRGFRRFASVVLLSPIYYDGAPAGIVRIKNPGRNKMQFIKLIREYEDLTLSEAANLYSEIEYGHSGFSLEMNEERAVAFRDRLEQIDGECDIEDCYFAGYEDIKLTAIDPDTEETMYRVLLNSMPHGETPDPDRIYKLQEYIAVPDERFTACTAPENAFLFLTINNDVHAFTMLTDVEIRKLNRAGSINFECLHERKYELRVK